MLEEAHHGLSRLEARHWWFVGARAAYQALMEIGHGPPDGSLRLLEVGCGSGGNLELQAEFGAVAGVEVSTLALGLVERRPALGLVQADAGALPFASRSFDGVNLFGVIEHLEDDLGALQEAARVCRPQGAICLLTSALMILWSHHDEANLHRRRYTLHQLSGLLRQAGLTPLRLSYQNFFTFLPTLIVRLWQRRGPAAARYDMGSSTPAANQILSLLLKLEAWWIRRGRLPIGVDLVAACRPGNPAK